MSSDSLEPLFCYGTLQSEAVQLAELGRALVGQADRLDGYRIIRLPINDPLEAELAGQPLYPALVPDSKASVAISGTLYWLTQDELLRADAYEADDYARLRVTLGSGQVAWVYVAARLPAMEV